MYDYPHALRSCNGWFSLAESVTSMPSSTATRSGSKRPSADLGEALSGFFDPDWYLSRYPDIVALRHSNRCIISCITAPPRAAIRTASSTARGTCAHYPDVASSGQHPLLHYLQIGRGGTAQSASALRCGLLCRPAPRGGRQSAALSSAVRRRARLADRKADRHPRLSAEPAPRRRLRRAISPSTSSFRSIAAWRRRGAASNRCWPTRIGRQGGVIVVDDRSPEPKLSAWLDTLAAEGTHRAGAQPAQPGLRRLGEHRHRGGRHHDVVLLNSDTEVPPGWLARLAGHAYATPRVASVSPFSNNATICGYPRIEGGPPAFGLGVAELDAACRAANAGRSVELPTTVGFCMYIRRAALADIGLFDADAFGRGYGEENDFCLRAERARLATSARLRHLRLPRGLGEFRRRRVGRRGAGLGVAARTLSALRATGGAACERSMPRGRIASPSPWSCSAAPTGRPS